MDKRALLVLHLPADVLRAVVRALPGKSVANLRLVCRALRMAVSIESILSGIDPDTVKWLVHGTKVNWVWSMNTNTFRVRWDTPPIAVEVDGANLVPAEECVTHTQDRQFTYAVLKDGQLVTYKRRHVEDKTLHMSMKKSWPLVNDPMMCCVVVSDSVFVMLTRSLRMYALQTRREETLMVAQYERALAKVDPWQLRRVNFPPDMWFHYKIKRFIACSDAVMWVLNDCDSVAAQYGAGVLARIEDDMLEFVCTDVMDICVHGGVVFILKTDGTMWTRCLDGVLRKINAFGEEKILEFVFTPALKSMWLIYTGRALMRYGVPFLLPAGGVEDGDKESVALLKAKLARSERRVARLMQGIK